MEVFGIFLSVPAAFITSSIYCLVLLKFVRKHDRFSRFLWMLSVPIIGLFAIEIIMLMALGVLESRRMLGPGFYVVHILIFFLGTPALANLFLLRRRSESLNKSKLGIIFSIATICAIFAFGSVLLQYHVSETLYGIDGENGPYSK
jgi:hypothetical protein